MCKIKGFIARDKDGMVYFHELLPTRRDNTFWQSCGSKILLPYNFGTFDFIQWEDTPAEYTLTLAEKDDNDERDALVMAQRYLEQNHSASSQSDLQNAMNIAVLKAYIAGWNRTTKQ